MKFLITKYRALERPLRISYKTRQTEVDNAIYLEAYENVFEFKEIKK